MQLNLRRKERYRGILLTYSSHPSQGFKDIQKSQRTQSKKKTKPKKPLNTKIPHQKKKKITSVIVKLSITIRQTSKEHLEGVDQQYLGNQRKI